MTKYWQWQLQYHFLLTNWPGKRWPGAWCGTRHGPL